MLIDTAILAGIGFLVFCIGMIEGIQKGWINEIFRM